MEASTGAILNQLPDDVTTGSDHYSDEDRGPSEISRELRCPDRYDQNHCV